MNMKKLLANLKHLPTTIVGVSGIVLLGLQDPRIQALAGLHPKGANAMTTAGAIATGLMLIFGVGRAK